MAGYNWNVGMSNNAVAAYSDGLLPASKIGGIPAALIEKHCRYSEWHHASKAFNCVKFYDRDYVRAVFGLDGATEETDQQAVADLAASKVAKKSGPAIHANCKVDWLEWSGSLKRPTCTERTELGCTVSVKGATATITLADGKVFTKRLSTRGFSFRAVAQ